MQTILSFLTDTFGKLGAQFLSISFNDIVDIALLAVVLYYVYRFVRERRAGKLALGLAILVVFYALTANLLSFGIGLELNTLCTNTQIRLIGLVCLVLWYAGPWLCRKLQKVQNAQ